MCLQKLARERMEAFSCYHNSFALIIVEEFAILTDTKGG